MFKNLFILNRKLFVWCVNFFLLTLNNSQSNKNSVIMEILVKIKFYFKYQLGWMKIIVKLLNFLDKISEKNGDFFYLHLKK